MYCKHVSCLLNMELSYRWQRIKTSHKQNAECSGNTKKLFQNKLETECLLLLFMPFS